jgi:hypothetical protein
MAHTHTNLFDGDGLFIFDEEDEIPVSFFLLDLVVLNLHLFRHRYAGRLIEEIENIIRRTKTTTYCI